MPRGECARSVASGSVPWTSSGWWPAPRVFRPIHGRLALGAIGLGAAGCGFLFGWGLVKEGGGGRGSRSWYPLPAPGWLPVAGTALVVVAAIALVAIHLSAPVSTGERLPEDQRRPVDERIWPVFVTVVLPFDAAMLTTSIASAESSDRWEPLMVIVVLTFAMPPIAAWSIRHRQW